MNRMQAQVQTEVAADKMLAGLAHLPADVAATLADYDRRVADGSLRFDAEGFAAGNPGQAEADADLMDFVASHIPLGPREITDDPGEFDPIVYAHTHGA